MKNDKLSYTLDELAPKLDESVFKSKKYGKSIEFERLTDIDRADVEWGVEELRHGFNLFVSDDPKVLRDAKWHVLVGAFMIGSRIMVSDSAKKFLDIERDGAKGRKGAITRQKKMQIWQDHVRTKFGRTAP